MQITLKNYRCFSDDYPANFILDDGFTAFIGINNAGKSAILKAFYEMKGFLGNFTSANGTLESLFRGGKIGVSFNDVQDPLEIFHNKNDRGIQFIFENFPSDTPNKITKLALNISRDAQLDLSIWVDGTEVNRSQLRGLNYDGNSIVFSYHVGNAVKLDLNGVFHEFEKITRSIYISSFRNALNTGGSTHYQLPVGTEFINTWKSWQSGDKKAQTRQISQVINDIKEIFGYKELVVIPSADSKTLQVNIDGDPYKLDEIGSGILQFILVLGYAATSQPKYIFVDEPELHLHPALQIKFLLTLGSYCTNGVIFSTHELGLARSVAQRIYSVQQQDKYSTLNEYETTPDLPEMLGELSFSSYKTLGFEKVLLVEGTHDLVTIQQFLRKEPLKKDSSVVLIPLGGASMINGKRAVELAEIKRICQNVFALIDSEKASAKAKLSNERSEFVKLCVRYDIKILVLGKRAIENYFTDEYIKQELGPKYSQLQEFEKLSEATNSWGKQYNWRIANRMPFSEIEKTDLGNFLLSI